MSRRTRINSALTFLLIALVMAVTARYATRIDLTEARVHSISNATREVVARLDERLTLTYYVSPRLEERFAQPREIADLLAGYEAIAPGLVDVRTADPGVENEAAAVEALGVIPQELQVSESGEQTVAIVYSGIVIEYLDRRDSIPFIFSTRTLEYDLTSRIASLIDNRRRTVGLLVGDPTLSVESDFALIAGALSQSYEVRGVRAGESLPPTLDAVVATDAHRLDADAVGELAAYEARGGAVLVSFDAVDVSVAEGLVPRRVESQALASWLRGFGIVVGDALLLDESANQIRVEELQGQFRVQRTYPYPHWPALRSEFASADHPVTARFTGADLYWPTTIAVEGPDASAEIIASSTPSAWVMRAPYVLAPAAGAQLARDAAATRGQYGLVAVASPETGSAGRLAVVSDGDVLRDALIRATGSARNIEFALSLVQWLANDESLLTIRTRAQRDLSLLSADDPRFVIGRAVAIGLNVVFVPAALAIVGLVLVTRRRRRSARSGGTRG